MCFYVFYDVIYDMFYDVVVYVFMMCDVFYDVFLYFLCSAKNSIADGRKKLVLSKPSKHKNGDPIAAVAPTSGKKQIISQTNIIMMYHIINHKTHHKKIKTHHISHHKKHHISHHKKDVLSYFELR